MRKTIYKLKSWEKIAETIGNKDVPLLYIGKGEQVTFQPSFMCQKRFCCSCNLRNSTLHHVSTENKYFYIQAAHFFLKDKDLQSKYGRVNYYWSKVWTQTHTLTHHPVLPSDWPAHVRWNTPACRWMSCRIGSPYNLTAGTEREGAERLQRWWQNSVWISRRLRRMSGGLKGQLQSMKAETISEFWRVNTESALDCRQRVRDMLIWLRLWKNPDIIKSEAL